MHVQYVNQMLWLWHGRGDRGETLFLCKKTNNDCCHGSVYRLFVCTDVCVHLCWGVMAAVVKPVLVYVSYSRNVFAKTRKWSWQECFWSPLLLLKFSTTDVKIDQSKNVIVISKRNIWPDYDVSILFLMTGVTFQDHILELCDVR